MLATGIQTDRLQAGRSAISTFAYSQGPSYLSSLGQVANLPGRRHLRSSSSGQRHAPYFYLSAIRRRSFLAAASVLF
jgi:hypothetical protein